MANQHITKHPNGWQVKGEGNKKASSVHKTQKDAIAAGREVARNQGSELIIHGEDGKIRARDSYGNDPFPPKG
ncbi:MULTISPECIES: DUF2188 domain-containing protein [Bacillus]|uniref:DUF2188 domain-containing protein n=1 Tax=Bacillus licheniformis TaxID=1402 RepID=A0AB37GPS2_BACLI|nr:MULTISPECIES: DUF2188 domain-containing protein [Bacillus]AUZ31604.1 DUF2188 domain-containing protein [Bacillus licheniformis]KFM92463.1 hypothetical protein DJ88_3303 [Bacillus paralicheniformis]MBU8745713.1 DUF2188 domain-containing protein [Bacillus paralicheniformis]MDR4215040.1 DUF2188 domain-containing protein [Bacillus paralicheniformis]MEC2170336.1 DUF2188 domain-containing protein [Bacillus paralicheniformis]